MLTLAVGFLLENLKALPNPATGGPESISILAEISSALRDIVPPDSLASQIVPGWSVVPSQILNLIMVCPF